MAYPSNPEKGFDVQYKLYDQMQWEDANVTLFTFGPAPDVAWGRVPGVPCVADSARLLTPLTWQWIKVLPTGARR